MGTFGLQVTIPAGGARLIMASGPFWQSVALTQSVKQVRYRSAKDATGALQLTAVQQGGIKADPTILVLDLVPATSANSIIDLRLLCKQVSSARSHALASVAMCL